MTFRFPDSVLVVTVSRIGDTLFTTPAIRAIARAYPKATITVLAHPNRAEVLENIDFIHCLGTITKNSAFWRSIIDRLPGLRYDLAFVYGYDKPLVRYALSVATEVVAMRQNDPALDRSIQHIVNPIPHQSQHAVLQTLRLPEALGIAPDGLRIAYRPRDAERARAQQRIYDRSDGASPLIGLQIASFPTKAYRDWPVEHFADLCSLILQRWPAAHFLLFGGKEELMRVQWLADRIGPAATLLAGQLSLRETGALMSLLDLYIGIDTGPTHMMSAYDIPMVALYHCLSTSTLTGPLQHPLCWAINLPAGDVPCSEATSMANISVDHVFGRVTEALAARDN